MKKRKWEGGQMIKCNERLKDVRTFYYGIKKGRGFQSRADFCTSIMEG